MLERKYRKIGVKFNEGSAPKMEVTDGERIFVRSIEKNKVRYTEYRVPSTEYRVPSTEYRVPSTEYRVPSTMAMGIRKLSLL